MTDFYEEMSWRGQVYQATDEAGLREHLKSPRRIYAGFDPTADSLTIGNMVPVMALLRAQRCGHQPIIVMGGGTGYVGDPSGKSAERQLLEPEQIRANVAAIRRIFEPIFDFSPGAPNRALMVDNYDWLGKLAYLDVLRDVGKHFSVNMMVQKESVKARLEARDQGISYTEFSYMILQAFDFLHLFREHGCTVQLGGSDQWGNIVCGCDLIRRTVAAPANESWGLTWPLVTKADGGKFGKTESGAVWMSADRTSPYAFYQFWLNAADADVGRFLRTFTLLAREEIEELERIQAAEPGKREAQRALAREVTALVHGRAEADNAEGAAKALFSGEVSHLPEAVLRDVFANVPASTHAKAGLEGDGLSLVDLLVATNLAASKREARGFLANGSVMLNGRKVGPDDRARTVDLLHGSLIALRRGKKNWHLTRWE